MTVLLALLGCAAAPSEAPSVEARLPADDAPHAPSLLRAEGDPAALIDPGCARCHPTEAAEWSSSAHATASFDNPWYRVSVNGFREGRALEHSRFCGGCHDPALVLTGAMDAPVTPGPAASAGVGCLTCHGAQAATVDGNASLTLDLTHLAPEGDDAASITAHRARMGGARLREPALCVSCHRGFLSPDSGAPMFLFGMDEGGPYGASPWAGSRAEVMDEAPAMACVDCHVAQGGEVSHRFPGGQTSLAAARGDADQLRSIQALLREAAVIDLPVVWSEGEPLDPAAVTPQPGQRLLLDVTVYNEGAGHRFPGGLRDTQDTWIEVVVRDARGEVLAVAGVDYAEGPDPSAWRLRSGVLDGEGVPDLLHQPQRFRAAGWDASVPPREARAARYAWEVPEDLSVEQLPLQVDLRLRHRRHLDALHEAACAEQRASPDFHSSGIDACLPQPVTDIAEASVHLGADGVTGGADRPDWQRLRDHALALRHERQEHLGDALPGISALHALAPGAEEQALALWLQAGVYGRQGRLDEALEAAAAAEALIGPHPALDRARGDAYAQVWRWPEAAEAYARVAEAAPRDTASWQDLAAAAGSAGQPERALEAARRGLLNQPRDESLLRSQALALADLGLADPAADAAWVAVRRPDDTSALRGRCQRAVEGCEQWLLPLPTLDLQPPSETP